MMFALLLTVQILAQPSVALSPHLAAPVGSTDSIYSSPAVRSLVSNASRINRRVPHELAGYRAKAESEIAIVARRGEGNEGVVSIEQTQNEVHWSRSGDFEQRVVGYRSQAIGLQVSTLSFFRQAWTVPVLYGNRLTLFFGRDTTRSRRSREARRAQQRLVAIHPLAEDRERVYRFSGGDTIVRMRVDGREIPIVRIVAEPRADAPDSTVAFRGELDLDATRHVLVRMRGYFVRRAPPPSLLSRLATMGGFEAVAFVELENGEIDGRFWLPTYQRFEAQAAMTGTTDSRSVFRIVTRIREHAVTELLGAALAQDDTLSPRPFTLSVASGDSLSRATGWRRELGDATGSVHSDDFNDIAPDVWRPTGAPRLAWRTQRLLDVAHVNRVEGLYTGYGLEWRLRDAAPGLTLRANAGWAWSEGVARGRIGGEWKRGATTYIARAGRSLDITNDFRNVFDSGSTVAAVFGFDNYDYVDRQLAAVGVWRQLGVGRSAIVRLESGPARDAMVARTLARGLFQGDSGFRENRGVRSGTYWRHWASLEWHPDVSAEFVRTGIGALLTAEVAQGDLRYTRLEGRLMGRRNAGPFTLAARGDVGTLLGEAPPPQQLFELGRNQNLPGYDYKEFVGTDAAVLRALAMYRLGLWRAPMRVRHWFLPPIAPALAAGVQSGWTQVRGDGGRQAVLDLGLIAGGPLSPQADAPWTPPRATEGMRTSVTLGLRLFGGAVGVGMVRAVDREARWRLLVDFSQGM